MGIFFHLVVTCLVFAQENWHKGSNLSSLRFPEVDEERVIRVGDFFPVGVSASRFLLWFDAVGWMTGNATSRKPVPFVPLRSLLEQVDQN